MRGAVPGGAGPARQGPVSGRAGRAAAAGVAGLVVAGGAGAAAAANQVSVLCGVTNERRVSPGQPGLGPGAGQTLRLALGRVHRPGLHLGEGAGGTHQARVLGIVTVLTVLSTNCTAYLGLLWLVAARGARDTFLADDVEEGAHRTVDWDHSTGDTSHIHTNMLTANILLGYCSRTAHEEEVRKLQFLNKHHVFPDPDVCTNMGKISRYAHC